MPSVRANIGYREVLDKEDLFLSIFFQTLKHQARECASMLLYCPHSVADEKSTLADDQKTFRGLCNRLGYLFSNCGMQTRALRR
jgi:hypothetical protein